MLAELCVLLPLHRLRVIRAGTHCAVVLERSLGSGVLFPIHTMCGVSSRAKLDCALLLHLSEAFSQACGVPGSLRGAVVSLCGEGVSVPPAPVLFSCESPLFHEALGSGAAAAFLSDVSVACLVDYVFPRTDI